MYRYLIGWWVSLFLIHLAWGQQVFSLPELPGLYEYQQVDRKPSPLNQQVVRKAIGYPSKAIKEGIEGKVFCRVLVNERGQYIKHKLTRVDHPLLGKAVDGKVHFLKFSPAFIKRKAVRSWANVVFSFKKKDHRLEFGQVSMVSPVARKLNKPLQRAAYFQSEGEIALQDRNFRTALRMFSQVIELGKVRHKQTPFRKMMFSALEARGEVYAIQGKLEDGIADLTEAIGMAQTILRKQKEIQQRLPDLYRNRAYLYLNKGEPYEALEDLRKIDLKFPSSSYFVDALLAEVYLELKQLEKSQEKLAEARLAAQENSGEYAEEFHAYISLLQGIIFLEKEAYELAFASFQESVEYQEDNPLAYFYKGLAIWQLEGDEHACKNLKMAVDMGLTGSRLEIAEEIMQETSCFPDLSLK